MQIISMGNSRLCLDSEIPRNRTEDEVILAKCHKQGGKQVQYIKEILFFLMLPYLQRRFTRCSRKRLLFSKHIYSPSTRAPRGYIGSCVLVEQCTSLRALRYRTCVVPCWQWQLQIVFFLISKRCLSQPPLTSRNFE